MMNDLVQSNPSPDKYSFVVHVDPLLRSIIGVDPQNAFDPVLASCTLPLAAVNSTQIIGVAPACLVADKSRILEERETPKYLCGTATCHAG